MEAVSPTVLRNKGIPIRLYELDDKGDPLEDAAGNPVTTEHLLRFTAATSRDMEQDSRWDGQVFPTQVPVLYDGRQVALRDPDGNVVQDDNGNPVLVTETKMLAYYGQNAWAQAMAHRTSGTVIATVALALRLPETLVERALVDGSLGEYAAAVQTAWSMAQGLEPDSAGKVLRRALRQVAEAKQSMTVELAKQLGVDDLADSEQPSPTSSDAAPATDPPTTSPGGSGGEPGSQEPNVTLQPSGT